MFVFDDLAILGLYAIILAWILQIFQSSRGEKEMSIWFVVLQAIGTFTIAYAGYSIGVIDSSLLNAIIGVLALVSLFIITTKKK